MTKGKEMRFQDLLRTVIVEQSRMNVSLGQTTIKLKRVRNPC
jgi:hypothetical protein